MLYHKLFGSRRRVLVRPLLTGIWGHVVLFGLMTAVWEISAQAWDRHAAITRGTLEGFSLSQPTLWERLNRPIEVTPIEQFLTKAYGARCTYEKARESVFKSVGVKFKMMYVEGVIYAHEPEFKTGYDNLVLTALPSDLDEENSQAVGKIVTPFEVLAVYSDEPDWGMDDDVPALKGMGSATKDAKGTATRLLRHFWYKGEKHFGVDFGKDQETDKRMQLFYELSLKAFSVGEPYWGYRFLANAIHYLQDMTQPFHVRAIISEGMVDKLSLVQGLLCDEKRESGPVPEDVCRAGDTLANAVRVNGWVVASYHALYEDFVLGLVTENSHGSSAWLHGDSRTVSFDRLKLTEMPRGTLRDRSGHSSNIIDMRQVIYQGYKEIFPLAEPIGILMLQTFGLSYKYDTEKSAIPELRLAGTTESRAYQMARHYYGLDDDITEMGQKPNEAYLRLVEKSNQLLARVGDWGRQVIESSLRSSDELIGSDFTGVELRVRGCR